MTELKAELKQALKELNITPIDTDSKNPTYAVYLTLDEMLMAEEALFERSTVLQAIADMNIYKNKIKNATRIDKKVILLEKVARKIAQPVDDMYHANDSLEKV